MHISLVHITLENIDCQAPMEKLIKAITLTLLDMERSPLQLTHQNFSCTRVPHGLLSGIKLKLFRLWLLL